MMISSARAAKFDHLVGAPAEADSSGVLPPFALERIPGPRVIRKSQTAAHPRPRVPLGQCHQQFSILPTTA